jgi:hypothetical protein
MGSSPLKNWISMNCDMAYMYAKQTVFRLDCKFLPCANAGNKLHGSEGGVYVEIDKPIGASMWRSTPNSDVCMKIE